MEKLTVVKVGGAIVEDPQQLNVLMEAFCAIEGSKVLVHGGGRKATDIAGKLGLESRMVNGRRITDKDMLQVVTMVYGGLVNKNLVAMLQARGVNALGLTGADINVMKAHKRPPVNDIDFGFVGDVDHTDGLTLAKLIREGITPVMAPLTHDGNGTLLNTNADTIASQTARALAKHYEVTLVYTFEHMGVLRNPEDPQSAIPTINRDSFKQLVSEGVVSGGMIPKLENAFQAIDEGVKRVIITHPSVIHHPESTIIS